MPSLRPAPLQVVCLTALANAYLITPARPQGDVLLQEWLQAFSWCEADLAARKAERADALVHSRSGLRLGGQQHAQSRLDAKLAKTPMFCFEASLGVGDGWEGWCVAAAGLHACIVLPLPGGSAFHLTPVCLPPGLLASRSHRLRSS